VTAPASSGGPSPLRVGAIALLAIGVVAGIVGLATLATNGGGDGGQTAAPPPSAQATETAGPSPSAVVPPPSGTTPTPTGDGSVPVPSFGPTPTNGIAAPPSTGSAAPPGGRNGSGGAGNGVAGSGSGSVRVPVRVYNNSTITGLAAQAAADFRNAGWQVEEVANYPYGIIPTSTVYYRPGTGEQQAARAIGDQFSLRVEPRFEGLDDASPGLIVIATNDYRGR
jgi:hypothetical protein